MAAYVTTEKLMITILLLGETGVGKSTWINNLANHLRFDSFQEAVQAARHGDDFMPIPVNCTMTDPVTYEDELISTGDDPNEAHDIGQSATRSPTVYVFTMDNTEIRIIDTPGLDDTRGRDHDLLNVDSILKFISSFKTLNCICIMFKTNETRCSESFKYCITEILRRLNQSASRSVVLFFTYASGSKYIPGESLAIIRKMFKSSDSLSEISSTRSNIFCFESESVKLLAKILSGRPVSDEEVGDYAESWNRSTESFREFIAHVRRLPPHQVMDTVSLNNAKHIIDVTAKPLMNITIATALSEIVLLNLKMSLTQNESLATDDGTVKVPMHNIVSEKLEHSMAVCTDASCIDKANGVGANAKICHKPCNCANCAIRIDLCEVFKGSSFCKICTHHYSKHKWMATTVHKTEAKIRIQQHKVEEFIQRLKDELFKLINTSAQLEIFLETNSMCELESSEGIVLSTFKTEIASLEINPPHDDEQESWNVLTAMRKVKRLLDEEIAKLRQSNAQIHAASVKTMIDELMELPNAGVQLKQAVKVVRESTESAIAESRRKVIKLHSDPSWLLPK